MMSFNPSHLFCQSLALWENGKFCISEPDSDPNWVGSFGSARYMWRYIATLPFSIQTPYSRTNIVVWHYQQSCFLLPVHLWRGEQKNEPTGMGLFYGKLQMRPCIHDPCSGYGPPSHNFHAISSPSLEPTLSTREHGRLLSYIPTQKEALRPVARRRKRSPHAPTPCIKFRTG